MTRSLDMTSMLLDRQDIRRLPDAPGIERPLRKEHCFMLSPEEPMSLPFARLGAALSLVAAACAPAANPQSSTPPAGNLLVFTAANADTRLPVTVFFENRGD